MHTAYSSFKTKANEESSEKAQATKDAIEAHASVSVSIAGFGGGGGGGGGSENE